MLRAVRRVACAFSLALLGALGPLAAGAQAPAAELASPLPQLAQRLADEIGRLAGSGPIELAPIEDRTSAASGAWAAELHALVAQRLAERLARSPAEARTRVVAILSQAGPRLIVSARVEEAPSGRLIDLLSATAEIDPALLALAPASRSALTPSVEVVLSSRTVPLDERVLDLAWVDGERLLLLSPEALALYRWVGTSLTLESRKLLPAGGPTVRTPGGLLLTSRRDASVWALTSSAGQAQLFAVNGARLLERSQADAVPRIRFRSGTNLLELEGAASPPPDPPRSSAGVNPAAPRNLGVGPWLAFEPSWPDGAVSADAELLLAGPDSVRRTGLLVGAALAPLWDGLVAAASADPPAAQDAILLLRIDATGAGEVGRLPVDGAVRALGALPAADGARLVAGVEEPSGAFHLEVFELRRPEAGAELP